MAVEVCPAAGRAFSLVELLVVMAIVGILFSMLLPVLARARLRAQEVRCLNSLRNLGVAHLLFSLDHHDRLVPHAVPGRPPPGALVPNAYLTYWPDLLRPYVSSPGMFLCPCHSPTNQVRVNLGLNLGAVGGYVAPGVDHGLAEAWVQRPGETVLFGDADYISPATAWLPDPDDWRPDPNRSIGVWTLRPPIDPAFHRWPSRMINRHFGRANSCFADCHVETVPASRLGWQHPWGHPACQWDIR